MTVKACTDEIGFEILKSYGTGVSIEDVCFKFGVSRDSFYRWKRSYRNRLNRHDSMQKDALQSKNERQK